MIQLSMIMITVGLAYVFVVVFTVCDFLRTPELSIHCNNNCNMNSVHQFLQYRLRVKYHPLASMSNECKHHS